MAALIGPAWGLPNVWSTRPQLGTPPRARRLALAEWIVEGEPGIDILALDRAASVPTPESATVQKNEETYRNVHRPLPG
jgi:hypothetical protein